MEAEGSDAFTRAVELLKTCSSRDAPGGGRSKAGCLALTFRPPDVDALLEGFEGQEDDILPGLSDEEEDEEEKEDPWQGQMAPNEVELASPHALLCPGRGAATRTASSRAFSSPTPTNTTTTTPTTTTARHPTGGDG